jgi:hypothetical protein
MKKIIAAALMLMASYAQADIPTGMPATATAMTPRDNCFQRLRGHMDSSVKESGYQVTAMTEGYGAEIENGDFKCTAKFELKAADGVSKSSPWFQYVLFANGRQAESKSTADAVREGLKGL